MQQPLENEGMSRRSSHPSSTASPGDAGTGRATPLAVYAAMALSRELDRQLVPIHSKWFPAVGEEATTIGAFCDLRPDDIAAPHYRGALGVHALRGADLPRLVAQA